MSRGPEGRWTDPNDDRQRMTTGRERETHAVVPRRHATIKRSAIVVTVGIFLSKAYFTAIRTSRLLPSGLIGLMPSDQCLAAWRNAADLLESRRHLRSFYSINDEH